MLGVDAAAFAKTQDEAIGKQSCGSQLDESTREGGAHYLEHAFGERIGGHGEAQGPHEEMKSERNS